MTRDACIAAYHGYIDCLSRQDWEKLGEHVHEEASHNGSPLGLAGYRAMLEGDFRAIPDLRFTIALLVAEPQRIAARLSFDCSPVGELFGLAVNGRRVQFTEHVFYRYEQGLIVEVHSLIDTAAIAAQL
ncbi:ester cyclase [Vannielia litorea]|uniref:ester cyclase n=1 Tax=Vannielia litorea TaxID=1217970 RepID=UPI001C96BA9F|nr:ester cyclase [Vannielia litorea]MBY6152823.1 ester cyclase [Vannielia litorea]